MGIQYTGVKFSPFIHKIFIVSELTNNPSIMSSSYSMSTLSMSTMSTYMSQGNAVFMPSFSSVVTEKLSHHNCPLWLAQIVWWLRVKNLMGFVDGTNPCPPPFLLDSEGKETKEVNPEYSLWNQHDQLTLLTINNFVSSSVLSIITRKQTYADEWKALENALHYHPNIVFNNSYPLCIKQSTEILLSQSSLSELTRLPISLL